MNTRIHASITLRLAVIYIFFSCAILFFIIISLYILLIHRLEAEKFEFLKNQATVMQKIFPNEPAHNLPNRLFEEVITEPPMYHYFIRVLDDNGKTLIETPGMDSRLPKKVFPDIQQLLPKINVESRWNNYLLVSAPVLNFSDKSKKYIQLGMNIYSKKTDNQIFFIYRRDMLLVWIIGIMVAFIAGIVITRKGLRPLHEMAEEMEKIGVSQLTKRFNPADWPPELIVFAKAFNKMLDGIEEGFTRLSQFSADIAHELRTPINNLMGEAEIALVRPRTNFEYQQILESSLEEFDRLKRIIESLLFLARAENPHSAFSFRKVALLPLIANIVDFYEAIAEEKFVNLIFECVEVTVTIEAEPVLLRQAISNLISNALQHTTSHGEIKVSLEKSDNLVQLQIMDTGEGIAEEHLPHLFDRLYRVDSARSQQTGGTGLGLAIVKTIVDIHHAKIEVKSQVGHGTTFILSFPSSFDNTVF